MPPSLSESNPPVTPSTSRPHRPKANGTLVKLNTTPIPAGTQEFITQAPPPQPQVVATAFISTWRDGPISGVSTLRPLSPKPAGLKTVVLLTLSSRDLIN